MCSIFKNEDFTELFKENIKTVILKLFFTQNVYFNYILNVKEYYH